MKTLTTFYIFLSLLSLPLQAKTLTFPELQKQLGPSGLLFISVAEHPAILPDAEAVSHLRSYHNHYLREPLYDDYLHSMLLAMLGFEGFQHLFKNLGGGFVPIKVEQDLLILKGTQDHCGGMEEAMVIADLQTGDVTSLLYSNDAVLVHSSYERSTQLPQVSLRWIERLHNAYGTAEAPTRNKIQLRKMAGDWCQGYQK